MEYLAFSKINLLKEWAIWSKCFGKIIVINGVSSVGKSRLANYLEKFGFNTVSLDDVFDKNLFSHLERLIPNKMLNAKKVLIKQDDIIKIFYGIRVNKVGYNVIQIELIDELEASIALIKEQIPPYSEMAIYDAMYFETKKFIFRGENVVIDTVMRNNEKISLFSYCFGYYPSKLVLLYSSLNENLERCFLRNQLSFQTDSCNYRNPLMIIDQYCSFYKFILKDNVTSSTKLLGKINKSKCHFVLDKVINHMNQFSCHMISDTTLETDQMQEQTRRIIEKTKHTMKLSNNNDVFMFTTIESDYFIDISCLGDVMNII